MKLLRTIFKQMYNTYGNMKTLRGFCENRDKVKLSSTLRPDRNIIEIR